MKEENKKFAKYMLLLILFILAATPISILAHEGWHIAFAKMNNGTNINLCLDLETGMDGSIMYVEHTLPPANYTDNQLSKYEVVHESIAYIISCAVVFIMTIVFAKAYYKTVEAQI
jgi:hypothetical protein